MVIKLSVKPLRAGLCYISGEAIEFSVSISANDSSEQVAWVCCQIHGTQTVTPARVKLGSMVAGQAAADDDPEQPVETAGTALQVSGSGAKSGWFYSSKPTILCADLRLGNGEQKLFSYCETLPADGNPPSFHGKAVQYRYRLTVALQRPGVQIKSVTVPLKILRLDGLSTAIGFGESEFRPVNPFLPEPSPKQHLMDVANDLIQTYTAARNYHVYNITIESGRLGKFTILKNNYKLGDNVIGFFDLKMSGPVRLVMWLAELQTEEVVMEEYRAKSDQRPLVTTYAKDYAFCLHTKRCQTTLQIPMSGPPAHSFYTDLVHVRWRLHFELVLTTSPLVAQREQLLQADGAGQGSNHFEDNILDDKSCPPLDSTQYSLSDGSVVWKAAKELKVETLMWDLPIKVYPCQPMALTSGSTVLGQQTQYEIVI